MRYHAPSRLLDDEEPAIGRHLDRLAHGFRIELGDRAVRPRTGVVEHDIGLTEPRIGLAEQARDRRGVSRIDRKCLCAGLGGERRQLLYIARRQTNAETSRRHPRATDALMPE